MSKFESNVVLLFDATANERESMDPISLPLTLLQF